MYLRVHPSTIYKLLRQGELPGFRIGTDWRFNAEAIDRWCAAGHFPGSGSTAEQSASLQPANDKN